MEQNSTLFSLSIDPLTKAHLQETARWGKFLSIIGFIMCGLVAVGGIFFSTILTSFMSRSEGYEGASLNTTGLGAVMAFVYIIFGVIYFFPCLFLFRFSTQMKTALNANEQDRLNNAFQNLKSLFRYVGIITIIVLALYGLLLVIALLGLAARG
jgi:hypothetical protein